MATESIKVGIIMGSKSDLSVMQDAADVLKELGVYSKLLLFRPIVHLSECLNILNQHIKEA
jgi:NCAIR mutase (PurE)-related protein